MSTPKIESSGNDANAEAISGTLAVILRGLIDLSRIWINKIENQYGRETLLGLADTFKKVVSAVADADPRDHEQIKRIVDEFLTGSGFLDSTKKELLQKIDGMKDERLRGVLRPALPVSFDIIKYLFDEDPANEEQIKARLSELLRDENGRELLTSLLSFVVKDKATAATIAGLILAIIGGVLAIEAQ